MRLRIVKLHAQSHDRPEGYVDDVLSRGTIDGDFLEITADALGDLREKYRPPISAFSLPPSAFSPEPPLPSLPRMAANAAASAATETIARVFGASPITPEEAARRLAICDPPAPSEPCEHFRKSDRRCSQCGCWMDFKTTLRAMSCPVGKW
jgi:hypothetical protein